MTERLFSFDPGGPHVGIAMWELRGERWRCTQARECLPEEFGDYVRRFIDGGLVTAVAYEVFRLGGGREAMQQRGSTFPTVECIGLARHHCRWAGVEFRGVERGVRKATLTRMKAIGWQFPRGVSGHVRDAIAVGAAALGWRAADHFEGDGIATRN